MAISELKICPYKGIVRTKVAGYYKLIFELSTQKNKKKFADAINILFTAVLDLRPQLSLKFLGWSPPDLLLRLSNTDLEE